MIRPLAVAALLLATTVACGQSSTPNPVTATPACAYSLSTGDTVNGYPDGGTFSVGVTTTPTMGCSWTAVSNASWIHITQNATGMDSGTFTFTIDANTGGTRTGTLTVGGRVITVNQSAGTSTVPPVTAACTYALTIASTIDGYPDGGNFTVGITTTPPTGCAWTAVAYASWLHITSAQSGSGSGTVTFTADANGGEARTGILMIAGEQVTFNQSVSH